MDMITNPTMDWLPWVVLGSVLLIGALIGFWNGWRTATYFLAWNIVFLVAGVLLFDAFYEKLIDFGKGKLPVKKPGEDGADIPAMLEGVKDVLKPILGTVVLVVILLVTNFLAFLIYWFVRKPLKRRIKDNKQAQLSNLSVRFVGAGVGVVTAFPIAVFATTASTIVSPDDEFNNVADFMTSGMSFTKFSGSADSIDTIRDSLGMMEASDGIGVLGSAFSGNLDNPDADTIKSIAALEAKHSNIERAMNNPQLLHTIPKIAESIMPAPKTEGEKGDAADASVATKVKNALTTNGAKFTPYHVSKVAAAILAKDVLSKYLKGDAKAITKFMVDSGLFTIVK